MVPHSCFRLCGFGHEASLRRVFFVQICGVFLVVVVLAEVGKSLSGSNKNKPEENGEDTTADVNGKKNEVSIKQILVSLLIAIIGIATFLFTIDDIALFLNS